jgi:rubredoxin
VGTGIGVGLIIVLWALGDVILGVLWLVTKPHKRYCPACGNTVRKGVMRCGSCGFDFKQAFGDPPGPAPPLPTA